MPRLEPPPGYCTQAEAMYRLKLSAATLNNYVKQGRVKRLVPPGRKHGFYSKEDIERVYQERYNYFQEDK